MFTLTDEDYSACFLQYFHQLYENQQLCDTTLQTTDGCTFLCHRLVLVSCCSKLQTQLEEADVTFIIMLDVSYCCLKILVDFMYTGKLIIKTGLETELLNAAHYLGVSRVLQIIEATPAVMSVLFNESIEDIHEDPISDNSTDTAAIPKNVISSSGNTNIKLESGRTGTLPSSDHGYFLQQPSVISELPTKETSSNFSMDFSDDREIESSPVDLQTSTVKTEDEGHQCESARNRSLSKDHYYQTETSLRDLDQHFETDLELKTSKAQIPALVSILKHRCTKLDDIQMLEQQVNKVVRTQQSQSTACTVQNQNSKSENDESCTAVRPPAPFRFEGIHEQAKDSKSEELISSQNNEPILKQGFTKLQNNSVALVNCGIRNSERNSILSHSAVNLEKTEKRVTTIKEPPAQAVLSTIVTSVNDEKSACPKSTVTDKAEINERKTRIDTRSQHSLVSSPSLTECKLKSDKTIIIQQKSLSKTALNDKLTKIVSSNNKRSLLKHNSSASLTKMPVSSASTVLDQSVKLSRCLTSGQSVSVAASPLSVSNQLDLKRTNATSDNYRHGNENGTTLQQHPLAEATLNSARQSTKTTSLKEHPHVKMLIRPYRVIRFVRTKGTELSPGNLHSSPSSPLQDNMNKKHEKDKKILCKIKGVSVNTPSLSQPLQSQSTVRYLYSAASNSLLKLPLMVGDKKEIIVSNRSKKSIARADQTSVESIEQDAVLMPVDNSRPRQKSTNKSKTGTSDLQTSCNGSSKIIGEVLVQSCKKCKKQFTSPDLFKDHSEQCHKKDKKSQLKLLDKFKTPDGFYCEICGYKTWKGSNFRKHRSIHDAKKHQCPQCCCSFAQESKLQWHIQNVHINPILCVHCGKQLRTRDGLKRHLKLHEKRKKEIKLALKSSAFKSAEDLLAESIQSLSTQIPELLSEVEEKTQNAYEQEMEYCCTVCGYQTKNNAQYNRHEKMHARGTFKCAKCDKEFLNAQGLAKHFETHQEILQCPNCSKTMKSQKTLYRHLHEGCLYTCEICGFSTENRHRIRYHKLKHAGNFNCSLCSKSYAEESKLKVHIKLSHIKPHICRECNKSFSTNEGFRNHMNIKHGNPETFVCQYCNKSFIYQKNFKYHLNKHEKSTYYRCGACGKQFLWRSQLTRHLKICINKNAEIDN